MTEKKNIWKRNTNAEARALPGALRRARLLAASLAAAALCMSLLLTACGSTKAADSPSPEAAAAEASTAGVTADSAATEEAASASSTKAEAADPGAAASGAAAAATASSAEFAAPATSSGEEASPAAGTSAASASEDGGFSAEGKGLVIVLDPGHSSQVPGTTEPVGPGASEMKDADTVGTYGPSSGLHEYELTMTVSQKLRAELEKRGYTVRLTHIDTVRPISCIERAQVANESDADAFIRVHANGSGSTEANGAMTICISQDNPYHPELYAASARLSEVILQTYCDQTGARREYVWETDTMTGTNWAEMPTTLIELGYMTNPDEDLAMAQDSYQKKMVHAIADGLDRWFAEMPEEELAMHPALTGDKPAEGMTGEEAAEGATNASAAAGASEAPAAAGTAGEEAAEGTTGEGAAEGASGGEAAEGTAGSTGEAPAAGQDGQ